MTKQPKPKKCKWSKCGKSFIPQRPLQQVCNYVCATGYNIEKQEVKSKKDLEVKIHLIKIGLKKLSEYEAEARKEFQTFIRIRDKDYPCISCGCNTAKQWHGGHYLKAELFTGLIFNEYNCHKQCSRCNDIFSGNELEYRDGLIKRYGLMFVENLESLKSQSRTYKFTKDELIDIKLKYKDKIKEIKNQNFGY